MVLNSLFVAFAYMLMVLRVLLFISLFLPYGRGASHMIHSITRPILSLVPFGKMGVIDFSPMVIFTLINMLIYAAKI